MNVQTKYEMIGQRGASDIQQLRLTVRIPTRMQLSAQTKDGGEKRSPDAFPVVRGCSGCTGFLPSGRFINHEQCPNVG